MSVTRFKSILATAAVASAALFGAAGAAQAAVYSGSWDPDFGAKFPTLAWTASATFDVPGDCLSLNGGTYNGVASACSPVTFSAIEVSFYDNTTPTDTFLESFNLVSALPAAFVQGLQIEGGELVAFSSDLSQAFVPTDASKSFASDVIGGVTTYYKFYLGFDIVDNRAVANLYYVSPISASNSCLLPGSDLCNVGTNPSVGNITPAIPEPGTYALLLAGLGVLGFVARHRRAA